ncbi:MAG: asparagine synthetase B [Chlorobi bacterium]|nr:asparagine synthetase B [Chlorobiota bacterium]
MGITLIFWLAAWHMHATFILIPMDEAQTDHLKAYGVVYRALERGLKVKWLLNYRGGSFLLPYDPQVKEDCLARNVYFEEITDDEAARILREVESPAVNMHAVTLEKPPKIAVYSPKDNMPWDDAVTLALTYAEIPYDVVYDKEVLRGELVKYDWLHLHHEDFTGQYGRFYAGYRTAPWYVERKLRLEALARELGFDKVSKLKLAVAEKIKEFVEGGGFLFAMCSATDTLDIALAAAETDICDTMYDGDPPEPGCQDKLDFSRTFAFENFVLEQDPLAYEFSNIDTTPVRQVPPENDYFELREFSAKYDPVPTMLTQNHTILIKGFYGQTTAFNPATVKPHVIILAETPWNGEVKYLHGRKGKGMFTFYGGHDPEDYQHKVGDPKTELRLYPTSPGYRLILNNVLFPAAEKQKKKT